jgi:uncharacterized membrane protein
MRNIFVRLLDELSVPYTINYADELYSTHPNRDNLLGLCQLCTLYGIATKGVNVTDKNLNILSIPSVLHVGGQFVILKDVTKTAVSYDWDGQATAQSRNDFIQDWDGKALLIESDKGAIEPSFSEHRNEERKTSIQYILLTILILLCVSLLLFHAQLHQNILLRIFALTDVLGIGICSLLLQKQVFQHSLIGDKVCSMFYQTDCNDILFSERAKIFGYSWSEIGLGYFVAHFLIASLLPLSTIILSLVGWCAMFYGIWSIYYQARVAKQWCVLCVFVQIILWINGFASIILFGKLSINYNIDTLISARDGIYFISVAAVSAIIIHSIVSTVALKKSLRDMTYKYRSLKCNVEVFKQLLHQSEFVPTSFDDSMIVFGNKKAKLHITVLTNPHCNPCAEKHRQIDEILEKNEDLLSVQYIFLAFNENLKQSNRFLIAVYQKFGVAKALEIYRNWYKSGKNHTESFMGKYPEVCCNTTDVEKEMRHHASWITESKFTATPTILVNGYVLPPKYDLADLPLFVDVQL